MANLNLEQRLRQQMREQSKEITELKERVRRLEFLVPRREEIGVPP